MPQLPWAGLVWPGLAWPGLAWPGLACVDLGRCASLVRRQERIRARLGSVRLVSGHRSLCVECRAEHRSVGYFRWRVSVEDGLEGSRDRATRGKPTRPPPPPLRPLIRTASLLSFALRVCMDPASQFRPDTSQRPLPATVTAAPAAAPAAAAKVPTASFHHTPDRPHTHHDPHSRHAPLHSFHSYHQAHLLAAAAASTHSVFAS